ncbi:MAG TPA: hypothetical protein VEU62_11460 [Bryobacterales bacterium]|nr:hypothetical protein [Bryobacterales bacterium]
MFAPDVEARFKKIEDNLVVMTELQRRFDAKTEERIGHLEAVQNAMARWQEQMAERQDRMADWQEQMAQRQLEFDEKLNILVDAQIRTQQTLDRLEANIDRLEASIDRILKSRSNGGAGPPPA